MWPFTKKAAGRGAVTVPSVDVREAYARSKRGATLVDVRTAGEYAHGGHPQGARSVPPGLIKKDATGLGRDDDILVICLSGHRSTGQARRLAGMGFTKVTNVHGGLMAWRKAGLPVKK